jgi:hypothetical protein
VALQPGCAERNTDAERTESGSGDGVHRRDPISDQRASRQRHTARRVLVRIGEHRPDATVSDVKVRCRM